MSILTPRRKSPAFRKGAVAKASDFQSLSDILDRATAVPLFSSQNEEQLGAALRIQRFEIVTVHKDHLMCAPLNGADNLSSIGEAQVKVAKQWDLQGSRTERLLSIGPIEYSNYNATYTERDAIGPGGTERQAVTPEYVAQDEIMAMYYPDGFGLEGDAEGTAWIEYSARIWAEI